ncbi:molybdopterin oxidoreductase family protein [Aquihabitans sp. McL0605]|uniref:molybdopterin oxidoreductase family protein n=1 Tax=Aquihabitans sp. McL0605 TaxID=3415671 RepID=UPI003CF51118
MSRHLADLLAREPAGFGIGQVPAARVPSATTRLVCGFCSTGCGLDVHLKDGRAVGLTPSASHVVNRGSACPKGWEALTPLAAPDRATTPLLRNARGKLVPVGWSEALEVFTTRFKASQAAHGAESAAFLSTGQIPTEEMALLGALAKFGMGMRHGDGNTRQCMASAVVAYKEAFGFDAPPYTYGDFEQSDVIVLVGSNLCVAHPIMWERITRNPNDPEIVVIDPRRTETAEAATLHLAPRPKSDLSLLYGVARNLIERGAVDRDFVHDHTSGFREFAEFVGAFTPERVSADTGLAAGQVDRLAALIADGTAVSFWWTMGVNQSHQGVRTAQALIDLALMTGNIGRPGTGANSITGQCNAMGSRLFSNTTSLLGGHDFADEGHRGKVAGILGIDATLIPDGPSLAYDRIIEGISTGQIRSLWVVATNGAHSWINHSDMKELLGRLDFLVVQDMYGTTETAQLADLVLPAAGWGEKDGTFINSERRLGLVQRVSPAPGQALADFFIFKAVADAWGCGHLFERWSDPEAVFEILQELSAGQPCDITGVGGYEHVATGAVQWPYATGAAGAEPTGRVPAERRLFADGRFFTPDQRARFLFEAPVAPGERPGGAYPLALLTGRGSASQWHTETRTSKSATLRALAPEGLWVDIHPADAAARHLAAGDEVVVQTRRGAVRARAQVTTGVGEGNVYLPMHHPQVNALTFPAFDPLSRQPSYKHCAAQVRAAEASDP